MSVVLMYHSLYEGNDTSNIDDEDLPYAVSKEDFIQQIDQIAELSSGIYSNERPEAGTIIITFDDGHKSNLDIAAPLLLERNLSAYFFITSGFIDSRPGFMSSYDVQALSAIPGMVVGSHGVTHKFFNDLSPEEAQSELSESKLMLEKVTKHPCESMSFPGGRYNQRVLGFLKDSGYTQWFGSDVGIVDVTKRFGGEKGAVANPDGLLLPMNGVQPLSRVAIRRTTQLDEFGRMINSDPSYFRSQIWRSNAKKVLQKTLGNRFYYGLYKSVSAR